MSRPTSRRRFMQLASASAASLVAGAAWPARGAAAAPLSMPATAAQAAEMPPLDPQMQAVITELMSLQAPKITDLTPFNARQGSALTNAVMAVVTRQGKPCVEGV